MYHGRQIRRGCMAFLFLESNLPDSVVWRSALSFHRHRRRHCQRSFFLFFFGVPVNAHCTLIIIQISPCIQSNHGLWMFRDCCVVLLRIIPYSLCMRPRMTIFICIDRHPQHLRLSSVFFPPPLPLSLRRQRQRQRQRPPSPPFFLFVS